jgi:hypothetical protein
MLATIFQQNQCLIKGCAPLERVYINQLKPPPLRVIGFVIGLFLINTAISQLLTRLFFNHPLSGSADAYVMIPIMIGLGMLIMWAGYNSSISKITWSNVFFGFSVVGVLAAVGAGAAKGADVPYASTLRNVSLFLAVCWGLIGYLIRFGKSR